MAYVSCSSIGEIFSSFSSVISWLLVILGWVVISRDHNRREYRKELRAAINSLIKKIQDCEEMAREYWQLAPLADRAPMLSFLIKRDLQRIAGEWSRIQEGCEADGSHKKFIDFRRAITSGEFDGSNRIPVAILSDRIFRISDAATDLTDALEAMFLCFIKPSRWWRSEN